MDCRTLESAAPSQGEDPARAFVGDRRAFPRLKIELFGVCSLAGGADASCLARDISVAGLSLLCDARAKVGAEAMVSLPQIGLLRGRVARAFPSGFAMSFAEGRVQRERVTNFLTWLAERTRDSGMEDRVHARIVPLRRLVSLLASGETSMARIIDVSRSGVALTSTSKTRVGDEVLVGSKAALVVRELDGGFAAQFVEPLDLPFDASIVL